MDATPPPPPPPTPVHAAIPPSFVRMLRATIEANLHRIDVLEHMGGSAAGPPSLPGGGELKQFALLSMQQLATAADAEAPNPVQVATVVSIGKAALRAVNQYAEMIGAIGGISTLVPTLLGMFGSDVDGGMDEEEGDNDEWVEEDTVDGGDSDSEDGNSGDGNSRDGDSGDGDSRDGDSGDGDGDGDSGDGSEETVHNPS